MPTLSPRCFARFLTASLLAVSLFFAALPAAEADQGECGQPFSTEADIAISDALFVLKTAVNAATCEPCICDVNNSGEITPSDALFVLKKAIGVTTVVLNCKSCGTTTTTVIDKPSTTSTSTTSTTTTNPVLCNSNANCSALGGTFRCNPNTGTCEKPCNRNVDCKDFYECNKTTHYCQSPALLF